MLSLFAPFLMRCSRLINNNKDLFAFLRNIFILFSGFKHKRHSLYTPNQRSVVVDLHPGCAALLYIATHKPMLQVTRSTTTGISEPASETG